jgi:hypothetical protein
MLECFFLPIVFLAVFEKFSFEKKKLFIYFICMCFNFDANKYMCRSELYNFKVNYDICVLFEDSRDRENRTQSLTGSLRATFIVLRFHPYQSPTRVGLQKIRQYRI